MKTQRVCSFRVQVKNVNRYSDFKKNCVRVIEVGFYPPPLRSRPRNNHIPPQP